MKLILGNGWEQKVVSDGNEQLIVTYVKNGKEYSKEEWIIKSKEENLQRLMFESLYKTGELGFQIQAIDDIKTMLSRLTEEAEQMKVDGRDEHFLYDNHHIINTMNNLLYRVSKELSENHNELMVLQNKMFNEVKKGY